MLSKDLKQITPIPAKKLLDCISLVPNTGATYLLLFRGGVHLLEATSFFEVETRRPLRALVLGGPEGAVHLYTGASRFLRDRLLQNFYSDVVSSSVRRTLLAIEHSRKALSTSRTPMCEVRGERSLTAWMRENVFVGILPTDDPFGRESEVLSRFCSPFNITLRRTRPYSRVLSHWRCVAFPAVRSERARRMRYI
jgi:hypothetical protein